VKKNRLETALDDISISRTLDVATGAIDMYVKKAEGLDDFEDLKKRGDVLRERLHRSGFHGATTLVILGSKPA